MLNDNQAERLVIAFEKIAEALTLRATLDADRFTKEYPPRRDPSDITVSKPKTEEDYLREDQGQSEESIEEWIGQRERDIIAGRS